MRGLTVGVEYPEGSVDPDPEGVVSRISLRVETFECKAGDGDGLGGTFEDLRKSKMVSENVLFAEV